jgi:MFS transporter, Spinster family, sphingosine-1-phosphate transporter
MKKSLQSIESPGTILFILSLINFFNYFDRQAIFPLFEFLKKDFTLSDFELGLLGTVFMVVHSVASVPLGILADRWIRKNIISIGVIVWSLATFFSGIVQNFHQLLAARSAVGIGEAAYGPAATSMIADKYPESKRAWASSIFHLGMFGGGTLGMISAGVIGTYLGWRNCFFIVGLPGLVLAILSWRIRETKQKHTTLFKYDVKKISSLFELKPFNMVLAGGVLLTFTSGAIISWITEFLVRYHKYTVSEASLTIGFIILTAGLTGIYSGGYLADLFYNKTGTPRSLVIAIGFLASTPMLLMIVNTQTNIILLASIFFGSFFMAWYYGPLVALIQDIVPSGLKATAYAFYLFFVHLLGDTLSPSVIGKVSDMSNLRTAFYLPIATNFLGALFFLITTKLINRSKEPAFHVGVDSQS